MFNFAKLEALQEEVEATTPDETSSSVDELDVSEDVKEEIKDIIEDAVSEVVETLEEGEAATDEVEETNTQLEETVEQSENLQLLYNVIKEHGISTPILALCDHNKSFREKCKSRNSSVSFESLTVTPSFGLEQQVALETLKETLKNVWETIKTLLKKVWNFLKSVVMKFVDIFRSYENIIKGLNDEIQKLDAKNINKELVKFSTSISGMAVSEFAAKTNRDKTLNAFKSLREAIVGVDSDDKYNAFWKKVITDSGLDHSFEVKDGKIKEKSLSASASDSSFGPSQWSFETVKSSGNKMYEIAKKYTTIKNDASKRLDEGKKEIEDLIKSVEEKVSDEEKEATQTLIKYLRRFISDFNSNFMTIMFTYPKRVMASWISAARGYVHAAKPEKK